MGFKDKIGKYYQDAYMQKYGDRLASVSGTVLSVKIEEKNYFIIKKIMVNLIIKPDQGRNVVKCKYKKFKWFKKPEFIAIKQGHKVAVMGINGLKDSKKESSTEVEIVNILNFTTKKDLVPVDHSQIKKSRQQQPNMMRR